MQLQKNIKHNDVSTTQHALNENSGAAAGCVLRLYFGSRPDTPKTPEGCLDDLEVMSQIRVKEISQRIPQRMLHSAPGNIQHNDVSSTQNARNGTSGEAAGCVLRPHFISSQDTPKRALKGVWTTQE